MIEPRIIWYLLSIKEDRHYWSRQEQNHRVETLLLCKNECSFCSVIVKSPEDDRRIKSPVLIYCDGNAGLFEFNFLTDRWSSKISKQFGIDIVYWNYRGFGMSTGTPSPSVKAIYINNYKLKFKSFEKNLFADVEKLYDHLKVNEKYETIGVFGTSLGGMVATHLASVRKVNILYVDRSFSCVSEVSYYRMLSFFRPLIRFVTDFDVFSPSKYYSANCYKVVSYDPQDSVIGFLASFPIGLAKLFAQEFIMKQKNNYYSLGDHSMFKNFCGFWRRTCFFRSPGSVTNEASKQLIPIQNQKDLFQSLISITDMIKSVLERNKKDKDSGIKNDVELQFVNKSASSKMKKISSPQFDCSLEESLMLNISGYIANPSLELEVYTEPNQEEQYEPVAKKVSVYPDQSQKKLYTPEKERRIISQNMIDLNKKIKYCLPNEPILINEIKGQVKGLLTLFNQYDSAGISLLDCFTQFDLYFDLFQVFILNLFVWGSYPPIKETILHNPTVIDHQKYAQVKTKIFIQKLEGFLFNLTLSKELSDLEIKVQNKVDTLCD